MVPLGGFGGPAPAPRMPALTAPPPAGIASGLPPRPLGMPPGVPGLGMPGPRPGGVPMPQPHQPGGPAPMPGQMPPSMPPGMANGMPRPVAPPAAGALRPPLHTSTYDPPKPVPPAPSPSLPNPILMKKEGAPSGA